jgi:hypothetical protein
VTTTIRSTAGRDLDRSDLGSRHEGGMHEEKNRSQPLDLSMRDRHPSDPGKVHEP